MEVFVDAGVADTQSTAATGRVSTRSRRSTQRSSSRRKPLGSLKVTSQDDENVNPATEEKQKKSAFDKVGRGAWPLLAWLAAKWKHPCVHLGVCAGGHLTRPMHVFTRTHARTRARARER